MEIFQEQEVFTMPRIGDKAPEFAATTTQGEISFPSDYKGEWSILFSHPADFTPVCTSEFMTFAHLEEKMNNTDELECEDWFFCTKKLNKYLVLNTILKK